ncbi:MAG: hypothetical protein Q9166_002215 [cf. Caloplaca sp. 2 TL-2023]
MADAGWSQAGWHEVFCLQESTSIALRTFSFVQLSQNSAPKPLEETFDKDGAVFIDGCDEQGLITLAKQLGRIAKPRNEVGSGTGVSNIRFAPGLIGKGYSSEGLHNRERCEVLLADHVVTTELFFHTDRSGWDVPPRLLITCLKAKSERGGESLLVDGQRVVETIKARDPSLYKLITDPRYSSFRNDDGSFSPRPIYNRDSSVLRFRYDDGIQLSASLIERFPKMRQMIYEHAYAIPLEPGQSYIVDNHRFLHGRTSFSGSRELLRILAYPHSTETVKPILFDVDGTLCRTEALSIDAFYRCVSDVFGKTITNENTTVNLHGATDMSLLQTILRFHKLDETNFDDAISRFFQLHPQYLEASLAKGFESHACPEVKEILPWLAGRHHKQSVTEPKVPIGLLTGNSEPNALLKIKAAGIDTGIFDTSISSFGDKHGTRLGLVRDSIRKLKEQYGTQVNVEDVTLVGDTPLDIECAKEAGCGIVAVSTGNYAADQLVPLNPDFACRTLMEAKNYLATVTCC